jgi:hypothetical protein
MSLHQLAAAPSHSQQKKILKSLADDLFVDYLNHCAMTEARDRQRYNAQTLHEKPEKLQNLRHFNR